LLLVAAAVQALVGIHIQMQQQVPLLEALTHMVEQVAVTVVTVKHLAVAVASTEMVVAGQDLVHHS
jgi:hypothetical protein